MKSALVIAALLTGVAGCAGKPVKPQASVPAAKPQSAGQTAVAGKRKVSPYAPAQEDLTKRGDYTRGGLYAPHIKDTAPVGIPDVDAIPEPEITDEPHSAYGNRSPYSVLGNAYTVLDTPDGYVEQGLASFYGNKFHGRRTSNLEVYDMYAFTAAHKTLPLPSFARVTNLDNGKSVVVRVNDRGPFHPGRVIDLSYAAAVKLGVHQKGTARVEVRGLGVADNAREPYDGIAAAKPYTVGPTGNASGQPVVAGLPAGVRVASGVPTVVRPAATTPASATAIDQLVAALPIASANAGERPPVAMQLAAASPPPPTPPAPTSNATVVPSSSDLDWRFDMSKDGKSMTADQFDAWLKLRKAAVATGKPKAIVRDPAAPPRPAETRTAQVPAAPAREPAGTAGVATASAAALPSIPARAMPSAAGGVTLQVAAFGAKPNAERALAVLRGAGVDNARLQDGNANGQPIWRLRLGPVDPASVPELSTRVAGLGLGRPQVVRE